MRDLQSLQRALHAFAPHVARMRSGLLKRLVDPARWADMGRELKELAAAADWKAAEESGRVVPAEVRHGRILLLARCLVLCLSELPEMSSVCWCSSCSLVVCY